MGTQTLADRWLRADHARFMACFVLMMVGALTIGMFTTSNQGRTLFGPTLGADFAEFHAVGILLNRYPASRLYDLELQDEIVHQVVPALPIDDHLPFVYPPFVALPFRLLARLRFEWSFATWLVLTLVFYGTSIFLALRAAGGFTRSECLTISLLALSFEPFAVDCWLGGQLSGIGCLAFASGLALRKTNRPTLAGLAFAVLLYKPTLPLLVVPLLVVGRQWRTLGGFAVGGAVLGLISILVAGAGSCLDFGRLMVGYGHHGGSIGAGFRTIKYVDLRAFLRLLGLGQGLATPLAIGLALPAALGLVVAWSRSHRGPQADLTWSATLCFTPVLNLYGPVYDVSIVVPGLILAAGALRTSGEGSQPTAFRWLLALVYLSALVAPTLVKTLGIQLLTVALAAMGMYLLQKQVSESVSKGSRFPKMVDDTFS